MKISFNWLKEYIDFEETPQELAGKLTNAGFEVEELYSTIQPFKGVVVAKVKAVEKHPHADKLFVCSVFDGQQNQQVICGAPNVAAGQLVPFARINAELLNGFKIKKAKIRGVESNGMICSKEELGLEKASEGIWALELDLQIGLDFYHHLATQQDYILNLAINANRPDCLSILGIAREVAAITGKKLKPPEFFLKEDFSRPANSLISIHIHDQAGCPRYAARIIRQVKIESSPAWMQERLERVGVRSINNIVDITNYVLIEYGHPLHAFDLDEIKGSEIHVRSSHQDELFVTLDNKERNLPENTVLICDKERPIAIGGIMGGQNSEVSAKTVDILLEGAYFNPVRISRSSKKLGLSSEASQRFERGADPNAVIRALNRAAALMAEIASGTVLGGICDVYPQKAVPSKILFRPERVNHLLGSNLSEKVIIETLQRLQLEYKEGHIGAPTFRVDLKREVDIIEEVARLLNYANLPSKKQTEILYEISQPEKEKFLGYVRNKLLEMGINEAITNSMLKAEDAQIFQQGTAIKILNPVSDDMTTMRPSLLPGLLKTVSYNLHRNQNDIRFFEIGRIFKNSLENELPKQPYAVALVMCGKRNFPSWSSSKDDIDFYDIKGYLESFLEKLFLDNYKLFLYDEVSYFEAKETIVLKVEDQIFGYCGKIRTEVAEHFDIKKTVYAFHLDIDFVEKTIRPERKYNPIPKFPYVEKDFAIVLDSKIQAADILNFIKEVAGNLLQKTDIFDIFEGGNIPEEKRSLAIRMHFQSKERTLNAEEVDIIFRNVIHKTTTQFKAVLRN